MTVVRSTRALRFRGARVLLSHSARTYATQSTVGGTTKASRKQVTIVNDDGRINWSDLTTREKAARTTQKTFHLSIILAGLVMTVGNPKKRHRPPTDSFRVELHIYCMRMYLHQIVRPGYSIGLWTRLRQARKLRRSLARVKGYEHSGNRQRTNGQELGRLRRMMSHGLCEAC